MGIEAIKGAGMTYQGSASSQAIREEAHIRVEESGGAELSNELARETHNVQMNETGTDGQSQNDGSAYQNAAQLKKAVEEINKRANNSEAIFGIHEGTNRVTIKIVDRTTKKIIRELPPEKTLDMIAKVWEMAGILVDEKR